MPAKPIQPGPLLRVEIVRLIKMIVISGLMEDLISDQGVTLEDYLEDTQPSGSGLRVTVRIRAVQEDTPHAR